jgi:hypothetical protein
MRHRTRLSLVVALAAACLAGVPGSAHAQGNTESVCRATFEVLHDDTVGALYLKKGSYTVTLLGASRLTCAGASDLLRQFLEDFDGRLPRPWRVDARTSSFTRGAGGAGFKLSLASGGGGGGGGGHHPVGAVCPGTFRVLHDDHIGTFAVPQGNYRLTLLGVGRVSCSRAARYLARFLDDYDGILPRPWFIDVETGSFMRGSRNVGFRIKELAGPPHPSGGGSGTYPRGKRCPGTFRVLHDDTIGRLRLAGGRYRITLIGGLSCRRAAALLGRFLEAFEGDLPRPWRLNVQTASFTGASRTTGFRIKPVSRFAPG